MPASDASFKAERAAIGSVDAPNATATSFRLLAEGVVVRFAGVAALGGVSLTLVEGEILGLIGPNGAGKTTMVNVLSGFLRPSEGETRLDGTVTTGWSPDRLSRRGLGRTFQNVRLFAAMTVAENVEAAGLGGGMNHRQATERSQEDLEFVGLSSRWREAAGTLPHGEQRLLGIARALATRPRILLLDEPAAGLNEIESDRLLNTLALIRDQIGCGLLVIEHDMRLVMRLCDRIQVLDYGKTIAEGPPAAVRSDEAVLKAYLSSERPDVERS